MANQYLLQIGEGIIAFFALMVLLNNLKGIFQGQTASVVLGCIALSVIAHYSFLAVWEFQILTGWYYASAVSFLVLGATLLPALTLRLMGKV